jgi:4'-phosphopantetheinyl transferase
VVQVYELNKDITVGVLNLPEFAKQNTFINKRTIEKEGTQFLLSKLLGTVDFKLAYSNTNKPFLVDRKEHLSISHSHDLLAIIIHQKQATGIDVELIRDKVLKIRHKFLNPVELEIAGDDVDKHIAFWSAKEALYKVYGLKELDFIKHLEVSWLNEFEGIGTIHLKPQPKSFQLFRLHLTNYCLVYISHEI